MQSFALSNELARLEGISEELRKAWADAKADWSDANSAQFESDHLVPLLSELSNARRATEQLAQVIGKAHKECTSW